MELECRREGPLVALAFKLEEGRFGQLTYMRIYSGTIRKGDNVINSTTNKRVKVRISPAPPPVTRFPFSDPRFIIVVWDSF